MNPMTLRVLLAWPLLTAEALAFGTAACTLLLRGQPSTDLRGRGAALGRLWRALGLLAFLLAPLALLAETASMAGVGLWDAWPLLLSVLWRTHAGRIWSVRLPGEVALFAVAWVADHRPWKPSGLAVVGLMLLALDALSSHAIDYGLVAVAVNLVHEAAAALWVGALLGLLLARETDLSAQQVSRLAGWCVAVIVLSGLYNAYMTMGFSLGRLLFSAYGRVLTLKLVFFLSVLGLGGYNRYGLLLRLASPDMRRPLLRNVKGECLILAGVYGLATLLANTPPPH